MVRIGVWEPWEPVWSRLGGAGICLIEMEDLTGPCGRMGRQWSLCEASGA
jgi:hypothetical protein